MKEVHLKIHYSHKTNRVKPMHGIGQPPLTGESLAEHRLELPAGSCVELKFFDLS